MAKHITLLLGLMGLLVFSALPAVSGIHLGPAQAAASQPQCATPFTANASNSAVLTYPFNSTGFSWVVADYNLAPGACALYAYTLANSTPQVDNWYFIDDFVNISGIEWWLVPASQLNVFFSSGHMKGGVGPFGTNESIVFANPQKGSEWYVYAVNNNTKTGFFSFDVEGEASPVIQGNAAMTWIVETLVPGETYTLLFNYTIPDPFFLYGAANYTTLTWSFTYNGRLLYTEVGIDPNISGSGKMFFTYNLSKGVYNLTVTNTGSVPVYVAMYVSNFGYLGVYVVINRQPSTSTTTTTTTTTSTTTSSPTTTTTSSQPTSSTQSAPPMTQVSSPTPSIIPPPAHHASSAYIYIIAGLVVVVIVLAVLLAVRRR